MATLVHKTISDLAPGFYVNGLTISVDRIFIREAYRTIADPDMTVKYTKSVDLLCWDDEGTPIICSIVTPLAIKVLGSIIAEKRTYVIAKYLVDLPGLGIHKRFHVKIDQHSSVDLVMGPFIERTYNLRCPSEIPYGPGSVGNVFDVCGFVRHASQVTIEMHEDYPVQQFFVVLESQMKGRERNTKDSIIIYMRGSWAKRESKKMRKHINKNDFKPFILVKYIRLERPTNTGAVIMCSVNDATHVVYHPQIQEVAEKRAELMIE